MGRITAHAAIVLLAWAAAGCTGSSEDTAVNESAGQNEVIVTGSIAYRERIALPPGSVATVTLQDISRADAPALVIAEQTIDLEGRQVPIAFEIPVDPASLEPRRRYAVRATIHDAERQLIWTTDTVYPVDAEAPGGDLGTLRLVRVERSAAQVEAALVGHEWVVEDIGNRGIVDNSRATLNFMADGTLAGRASCNNYTTTYERRGDRLELGEIAVTLRACVPALDNQEAEFLRILRAVTRFELAEDGALILVADTNETILARHD